MAQQQVRQAVRQQRQGAGQEVEERAHATCLLLQAWPQQRWEALSSWGLQERGMVSATQVVVLVVLLQARLLLQLLAGAVLQHRAQQKQERAREGEGQTGMGCWESWGAGGGGRVAVQRPEWLPGVPAASCAQQHSRGGQTAWP